MTGAVRSDLPERADVVIVGGGHNGLVAACYLALAGRSVVVLERDDHLGGAAVSREVFPGIPARLSKYSYLLSLFPTRLIAELELGIRVVRRRISSYTPDPADPERGLLIRNDDPAGLRSELHRLTGSDADFHAWQGFYADTGVLARAVFDGLTEPLPTEEALRESVDDDRVWSAIMATPIGDVLDRAFGSDLVRGIVATDALIGTFTSLYDPSLLANRCLLYHTIGNGTGDWDVPVGGMGAVTGALARRAAGAGARLLTGAEVTSITPDPAGPEVDVRLGGDVRRIVAGTLLVNAAPQVLDRLVTGSAPVSPGSWAEGSQLKVNLLLDRLPAIREGAVAAENAFAGTFHINETQSQLETAYQQAVAGSLPGILPAEVYCHTLSDRSILDPSLAAAGMHTLTLFGLHTPHRLFTGDPDEMRDAAVRAAFASLDSVLGEPIAGCVHVGPDGRACVDVATTVDLERDLALPAGNIFHTPVEWPWAAADDPRGPWGVGTSYPRVLLCGSGAARGGAVSGIPGHNAAMAVLRS